jgi:hypothetical protein
VGGGSPTYFCGVERQYVYSVLFRDVTTGALHHPSDLAVRTFGTLLGFADLRLAAEQLGFTEWTLTPEDVRYRYPELSRVSALTPNFRDMYDNLRDAGNDLRWLCVRMGNHSARRADLLAVGGIEETLPGSNSDQDLGLLLLDAGVQIELATEANSILLEHRRNLRALTDHSGLQWLSGRWSRSDVRRLHEYFARGANRSIADYRRTLALYADQETG